MNEEVSCPFLISFSSMYVFITKLLYICEVSMNGALGSSMIVSLTMKLRGGEGELVY